MSHDKEYKEKVAQTLKQINELYNELYRLAALWAAQSNIDTQKRFWFTQYPALSDKVDKLIQSTAANVDKSITSTTQDVRKLANEKNDVLTHSYYQKRNQKPPKSFIQQKKDAFDTPINPKAAALNLSQRVWKYNPSVKAQMQAAIDIAIKEGKSAQYLAGQLKAFLNEPDKLFRKVRDQYGNLRWSKKAMMYNPGQGVYKSAHQNALRLARNEINTAYRQADYERWKKMDFITGYRIQNSTRISTVCPICKQFDGVVFPKSFKFTGFHVQCLCVAIPVTSDEMPVVKMPTVFMDFLERSKGKINPDNAPNWYKDNKHLIDPAADALKYRIRPDMLKRRGFEITAERVNEYNDVLKGFNLEQFDTELAAIAKNNNIEITKRTLSIEENKVHLFYRGREGFFLERTFQNNTVYHDLLTIPEKLQGKGIAKQILQSLYKQYQSSAINKIELTANIDIGGYAWGKYGFSANASDARSIVEQSLLLSNITKKDYHDAISTINKYLVSNKNTSYFPMNYLAQKVYGLQLLKGSEWKGELDLNNLVQRTYFEDYLFNNTQ